MTPERTTDPVQGTNPNPIANDEDNETHTIDALIQRLQTRVETPWKPPHLEQSDPNTSSDDLHIIQWNVQGMCTWKKRTYITAMIKSEDPDLILLQETNLPDGSNLKIPGYQVFHQPGPRGLVTAVKHSIPAIQSTDQIPAGRNIEILGVKITLEDGPLLVCNIYKNCNRTRNAVLTPKPLLQYLQKQRSILAGDLNAHHPIWGGPNTRMCEVGEILVGALESSSMVLLNTEEPTHIEGGSLDLTIVTADLAGQTAWKVSDNLVTDHYAIHIHVAINKLTLTAGPPRRQYHKADWELFRAVLSESLGDATTPQDIDEKEAWIATIINEAADSAIPTTTGPKIQRKDHWFRTDRTQEMNKRVNQRIKILKRNKNEINKRLLREVVAHSATVSQETRTEKWLEWCSTLDQNTSIGKMWERLRFISGKRMPTPTVANPEQTAEEIIQDFSDRASSDQLPADTREKLEDLRPQRKLAIRLAKNTPDLQLDREFSSAEMKKALRNKATTPGPDGITHQMIHEAGVFTQEFLLDLINQSYREQKLPSAWKKANIIPVP